MKITFARAVSLAALLLCPPWSASAAPSGGVPLIAAGVDGVAVPQTPDVEGAVVPVQGQPFSSALRLTTRRQPHDVWDLQTSVLTTGPIKKGDTLLASFWMRTVKSESGYGRTNVILEDAASYNKSLYFEATAGGAWTRILAPAVAAQDEPVGGAALHFHLGFPPQTIEIADPQLIDYGTRVPVSALPRTTYTYAGREPDAPWRRAAQARIEKIRKGGLVVRVIDAQGRAVPHARVHVQMTRHAFAFGTAVDNASFNSPAPEARRYQAMTDSLFERVTVGNGLKWGPWEGWAWGYDGAARTWVQYHQPETLAFVRGLRGRGKTVRGHNLVWPSWGYLPKDLPALKSDPAALQRRILAHITEEMTAAKGLCAEWDVVNEPYGNHDLMDALGWPAMAEWFQTAHAIDPDARLFVNDNGIIENNAEDLGHIAGYEAIIRRLLDEGAPLGGIGMEGHFSRMLTPPDKVLALLDRFAKFGLPIEITEFDVNADDRQLEADYWRDYLTVTFSHPAVSGFVIWGFWEGDHWLPEVAPWARDWTPRPSGKIWMDLVRRQWWTDVSGATDAHGAYRTRGFLGDYRITATGAGRTRTLPARLSKNGDGQTVVTVRL